MPILVRVYANLNDLARSLRMSDVIIRDESMHMFAEQFTNSHVDCDFINVGKGKENTDAKIRREFMEGFFLFSESLQSDSHIQDYLIIITKMRNVRKYSLLVVTTMVIFMTFVNMLVMWMAKSI